MNILVDLKDISKESKGKYLQQLDEMDGKLTLIDIVGF
jgi:hypothetical protein